MTGSWYWILINNPVSMLHKSEILLFILLVLASCRSSKDIYLFSTFREPATDGLYLAWSEDGYQWNNLEGPWLKPEAGNQKVMRDPSIACGADGMFHMVWTSSWKGDRGFGYTCSKDLIHWSVQKFIPVMQHDSATVNVWAPEIFFDNDQKKFLIIWASTIPYRFEKGEEEEMNNHRLYYTTTTDFNTFEKTRLYLDPGFSVIDAILVKRSNRDYVLVMKDNTRPNRNLRVGFSASPLGPFNNISGTFTPFCSEGPAVLHLGNEWLIYYDAYREKVYGAVKTTDFINFTDISGKISLPAGHKHGTIFTVNRQILKDLLRTSAQKCIRNKQ
jgi:hypothetical protein